MNTLTFEIIFYSLIGILAIHVLDTMINLTLDTTINNNNHFQTKSSDIVLMMINLVTIVLACVTFSWAF